MNRPARPQLLLFTMILFIGDSHTYQSFGRKLDRALRTLPDTRVETVASWGSAPQNWYNGWITEHGLFEHAPDGTTLDVERGPTPLYRDLLARDRPDLTIIALGSNLFYWPLESAAGAIRTLLTDTLAAHSACVWVGPPDSRVRSGAKMDALYEILRTEIPPHCRFIDSRKLTRYPKEGGDGRHYDYLGDYGQRVTDRWAARVFQIVKGLIARSRDSGRPVENVRTSGARE